MEDAAPPILNLAILGAFMVAGFRELGRASTRATDESDKQ